jgi:hypothetical protein
MRSVRASKSDAIADQTRKIRAAVKKAASPMGFDRFELEFGEDSTGDPAVWIKFSLKPGFKPTEQNLARLNDLSSAVKDQIFDAGVERLPYVDFISTDRHEHGRISRAVSR